MDRCALASLAVLVAACGTGPATHSHDGGTDAPTAPRDLGAPDGGATDLGGGVDLGPMVPGCTPVPGSAFTIATNPVAPVAPASLTLVVRGPDPLTNLVTTVMDASGHTLGPPTWVGVDMSYRWRWTVDPTAPGDYCVTLRADPSSTLYARTPIRILGSAPVDGGVPDGGPPTGTFVTRSGDELMAGAERLRFVGVNMRGLPHYGTPLLPYASTAQIDAELDAAVAIGARVVRVFAAGNDADDATVAARMDHVLDAAQARGLWVLVVLTDFYAETGMHPMGDDGAYTDTFGSLHLLGADWFRSGFRTRYLPWVSTLVARHASHPAVFAWELGNEIKCDADHAAFLAFASETGAAIRALDTRHLIASGMITSAWMMPSEAASFYASSDLDVITLHEYDASHAFDESSLAAAAGKPWIVEEAGFSSGARDSEVDADVRYWIDARAGRGYMQWGFTSITPDNGDGDGTYGMDHLGHAGDWDALTAEYVATAARIR